MNETNVEIETLDLKGYKCPLPVLKARKAMYGRDKGTVFSVLVSDPKAPADFGEFCTVASYELLDVAETDFGHQLTIKI